MRSRRRRFDNLLVEVLLRWGKKRLVSLVCILALWSYVQTDMQAYMYVPPMIPDEVGS